MIYADYKHPHLNCILAIIAKKPVLTCISSFIWINKIRTNFFNYYQVYGDK